MQPPSGAPRRLIGLIDATALVVGSMIGSGIFIVSAESARLVGTPARLLAVWLVAGLLTLLAANACAELATMFPLAGGPYVFFREAYGPLLGFLYGWTTVLVIQTGTIAAVAVAFSKFLGLLVPSVAGGATKAVAALVVVVLTGTNALGLQVGTRVQNVLTVIKVLALLALTAGGILFGRVPAEEQAATAAAAAEALAPHALVLAFAVALVGPAFSQSAWTNVTFPGAEVVEPGRTFPRALLLGCTLVAGLYVLANVGYLRTLGFLGIAHATQDRVGTAAAAALVPGGGAWMAAAILVSTFGCANGLVLSGARVVYALAADGHLPAAAARLNQAGVPGVALALQAAWALVLVLSGTYTDLLRYVVAVEFVVLILLVVAVPALRRRLPAHARPYRAWGHPLTSGLFVFLAGTVVVLLAVASPRTTLPGFGLVLAGIPVYLARRSRGRAR
ncbi:MAG TPA: amino acid permease [Thermoanaerobaculia bacterium]|jgi:APA family basic amino acid/polyamine antiporter